MVAPSLRVSLATTLSKMMDLIEVLPDPERPIKRTWSRGGEVCGQKGRATGSGDLGGGRDHNRPLTLRFIVRQECFVGGLSELSEVDANDGLV